jgi:hypothetical protein
MRVLLTPGQLDQPTDLAGELGSLRVGAPCPPHGVAESLTAPRLKRAGTAADGPAAPSEISLFPRVDPAAPSFCAASSSSPTAC